MTAWSRITRSNTGTTESSQKIIARTMLCIFENLSDIGDIIDFQMEIKLSDQTPINESYRHKPWKLHEDVKNYIDNLITNESEKKSNSGYASPVVCVRKTHVYCVYYVCVLIIAS